MKSWWDLAVVYAFGHDPGYRALLIEAAWMLLLVGALYGLVVTDLRRHKKLGDS